MKAKAVKCLSIIDGAYQGTGPAVLQVGQDLLPHVDKEVVDPASAAAPELIRFDVDLLGDPLENVRFKNLAG